MGAKGALAGEGAGALPLEIALVDVIDVFACSSRLPSELDMKVWDCTAADHASRNSRTFMTLPLSVQGAEAHYLELRH